MELIKGFKQTEVGVIPESWDVRPLEEFAQVIMGQSPIGSSYNQKEIGIALINGPTEFTEKYPIKKQWTTSPTKLSEEGDILLCVRGSSTGRINIANDKYCIGRGIAAIRAKTNSDNLFLEFQVSTIVNKILALTAGSTFPNIDGKSLRSIQVALPPLPEQRAIATALSDMDALLTALDSLIAKKVFIKQGAMQELLTGKRRLSGFSGKWEEKKLGDIAEITKLAGYEYTKYFNSYKDGGNIIVIRGTNITNNSLDLSDIKTIPQSTSNALQRSKLQKGDLVFAYVGTIGPIYLITENDKYHLGPNTARITVKDKVSPQFVFLYFCSNFAKKEIEEYVSVGAQPSLSMSKIRKFKIALPDYPEQQAIAEILSDMDAEISALETRREKTRLLKQGMMQELLGGRIRLNHD